MNTENTHRETAMDKMLDKIQHFIGTNPKTMDKKRAIMLLLIDQVIEVKQNKRERVDVKKLTLDYVNNI